jgi:hypothetical protein
LAAVEVVVSTVVVVWETPTVRMVSGLARSAAHPAAVIATTTITSRYLESLLDTKKGYRANGFGTEIVRPDGDSRSGLLP